jgi:uncharacterized membrane protein
VGALMDIFGGYYPFISGDVLYLIGLSFPFACLFGKLKTPQQIAIIFSIFAVTPALQVTFGYNQYPVQAEIFNHHSMSAQLTTVNILKNWLIEGWFPIFPWFCIPFLGILFYKIRKITGSFANRTNLQLGLTLLGVGALVWSVFPGPLYIRDCYSELFYPVTIGYVLVTIGVIATLFCIVDFKPKLSIYKPFQILGESSLFMYITHCAIIGYALSPLLPFKPFCIFALIYFALITLLIIMGYVLRKVKSEWTNLPFIIKFLIGG